MFGEAEALCSNSRNGAASVSLPARLPATSARTISARDVAFPMVNPYRPADASGAPISGETAWPFPRRLGKRYYGLSGMRGGGALFSPGPVKVNMARFRGMGDPYFDPTFDPIYVTGGDPDQLPTYTGSPVPVIFNNPPYTVPPSIGTSPQQPGGGIAGSILGVLQNILPATISAIKGQPYYPTQPYYQGAATPQTIYGAQPTQQQLTSNLTGSAANLGATAGASVGNLASAAVDFATQNPMLLLVGGAALFLLFREPPRRRNPSGRRRRKR